MSPKKFLLGSLLFGATFFGLAAEVQFYDEALPSSLNPLFASTMVDHRAQELYFDRLYYNDTVTNKVKSRLINDSLTRMDDAGKALRLTINPDIRWHNGKKFTSKDICFTIDSMLNNRTPSPIAKEYREHLQRCQAVSNSEAKITFKKIYHNPRERLKFFILPESEFKSTYVVPDDKFSSRPVGTGPMAGAKGPKAATFKAHRKTSHHAPKIDAMKLSLSMDPIIQVNTIRNGAAHGIISVPPQYRPELSTEAEVGMKTYDLRSWWFIAVNTNSGALSIPEVRKALNYVIDRSDLREKTTGVKKTDKDSPCEFISGPFVKSSAYYNSEVPVVELADKAKAEGLLSRAGLQKKGVTWFYNDEPVVLRIGMNATLDKEAPDLLSQIGNQFAEAGFSPRTYKISDDDWTRKVITGRSVNDYDLVIGKWSFGINEDVNNLFQTRVASKYQGRLNIFNYTNKEVDGILAEYEKARSTDSAKNAYHKLHKELAGDLPYLFLWKLDTRSAWRSEIKNNLISPFYYFTAIDDWKLVK